MLPLLTLIPSFGSANSPGLRQNALRGKITALIQTWLVMTSNFSLAMVSKWDWGWEMDKRMTESFLKALAKEQLVPTTWIPKGPKSVSLTKESQS